MADGYKLHVNGLTLVGHEIVGNRLIGRSLVLCIMCVCYRSSYQNDKRLCDTKGTETAVQLALRYGDNFDLSWQGDSLKSHS